MLTRTAAQYTRGDDGAVQGVVTKLGAGMCTITRELDPGTESDARPESFTDFAQVSTKHCCYDC